MGQERGQLLVLVAVAVHERDAALIGGELSSEAPAAKRGPDRGRGRKAWRLDDGTLRPVVSATFGLSDLAAAFGAGRDRRGPGKVVISVATG